MARTLITSALPYINGIKHLGNLAGSMLPADVYARYLRQRGHEVLFICATDEHGTPAELAAARAGLSVEEYCRQQHEAQKAVGEGFGLSFDHFGRSSSPQNHELTQHFGRTLAENGFVEERVNKQVYSRDDQRFLPDRYVVGTWRVRGCSGRPVRELHPSAGPHPVGEPAIRHQRWSRRGVSRQPPPVLSAVQARARTPGVDHVAAGLAHPNYLNRAQMAQRGP